MMTGSAIPSETTPADFVTAPETPAARFPISKVVLGRQELENVSQCITSGWISSRGGFVSRFECNNAEYYERDHAVATGNGTAALHLALLALGVGPGDCVIVPDLTFAATINAVLYCGATPVIVPISAEDWNIDCQRLPDFVTRTTKAVIAVHLYGRPCRMDKLVAMTQRLGLGLIEDCAQAHGARFGERPVGSFGDIACFSFFGNKIVTTGEGGVCVTDDPWLESRMRLYRDHGKATGNQYWHTVVGYNYRMTNLQAAVGCAQMERIDEFIAARDEIQRSYQSALFGQYGVAPRAPYQAEGREVCWLETVLTHSCDVNGLIDKLASSGIECRRAFTPLSRMPIYSRYAAGIDPVSDKVWRQGLSLPTYVGLRGEDIQEICRTLVDCLQQEEAVAWARV